MTEQQAKAIRAIADMIVDTIAECDTGFGIPGGHIYVPLMGHLSLDNYQRIMDGLVKTGRLVRNGECYSIAKGVKRGS